MLVDDAVIVPVVTHLPDQEVFKWLDVVAHYLLADARV